MSQSQEYICLKCGTQGLGRPDAGSSYGVQCGSCGARALTREPEHPATVPMAEKAATSS